MLAKSQVKYIQSLGHKKFRDEHGVFVAEGPKLVLELLRSSNCLPVQGFALPSWLNAQTFDAKIKSSIFEEIDDITLERISFSETPNQVLCIFKKPVFEKFSVKGKLGIMLDDIQDPGNVGTILRTADWFGIDFMVCSKSTADIFNPKVVQSTMGSICRIPVWYEDLSAFANDVQVPLYGAMLDGESIYNIRNVKEGIIVIGNESRGISDSIASLIKYRVTIPGHGKAESLNAAVAAGVIMAQFVHPLN